MPHNCSLYNGGKSRDGRGPPIGIIQNCPLLAESFGRRDVLCEVEDSDVLRTPERY